MVSGSDPGRLLDSSVTGSRQGSERVSRSGTAGRASPVISKTSCPEVRLEAAHGLPVLAGETTTPRSLACTLAVIRPRSARGASTFDDAGLPPLTLTVQRGLLLLGLERSGSRAG